MGRAFRRTQSMWPFWLACWVGSGGVVACEQPKPPPAAEASAAPAKPKVKEGGACQTSSDCDAGLACAEDRTCQTRLTIDCRGRVEVCGTEGRCTGQNGRCVAASNADCKASSRCKNEGRCSAKEGKCSAETREDCRELCAALGRCTPVNGGCDAASDDECKASKACATSKKCRSRGGRCTDK